MIYPNRWDAKLFRSVALTVIFCWVAFVPAYTYALDGLEVKFPETPLPRSAQWSWVGKQMVVDGVPMSIRTFTLQETENGLINHFEGIWKTQGHGAYTRNKLGPKSVLAYETQDFYTTVQYEVHEGEISGSLTVSYRHYASSRSSKPKIIKPPGAKVVSRVESLDDGIRSESVTYLSRRSPDFNSEFYASQLVPQGWVAISRQCDSRGCLAHYQSFQGQLQISIKDLPGNDSKGSRILVHLIK